MQRPCVFSDGSLRSRAPSHATPQAFARTHRIEKLAENGGCRSSSEISEARAHLAGRLPRKKITVTIVANKTVGSGDKPQGLNRVKKKVATTKSRWRVKRHKPQRSEPRRASPRQRRWDLGSRRQETGGGPCGATSSHRRRARERIS